MKDRWCAFCLNMAGSCEYRNSCRSVAAWACIGEPVTSIWRIRRSFRKSDWFGLMDGSGLRRFFHYCRIEHRITPYDVVRQRPPDYSGRSRRSKVLPRVRKVIESVRIDPVPHGLLPLLIRDWHITYGLLKHSLQRFDDFIHGGNLAKEFIRTCGREACIGEKSSSHTRDISALTNGNTALPSPHGRKTVPCSETLLATRARKFS